MPEDAHGEYDADAGSKTPHEEDWRCNAKLRHWQSRYGEPRYCGQFKESHFHDCGGGDDCDEHSNNFCKTHSYKENWMKRAKELFQHGAYTKSREHYFDKVGPWAKLWIYGKYHSLLDESVYDYAYEFEEQQIDFSEIDDGLVPDEADEDDVLDLLVPYATEHMDKSDSLWLAACDGMNALMAKAQITEDELTVTSAEHANLTSPTENNPSQEYKVIEEDSEHHLNLAYSRLVRDRKELLSYGGVVTGTEADEETNSNVIAEEFLQVEADPGGIDEGSGMIETVSEGELDVEDE